MKTCPFCKSNNVIIFDSGNDLCFDCEKYYPAVAVKRLVNLMDEFEVWANKNLTGIYKPIERSINGEGYKNEYLNECWLAYKAGKHTIVI